jgi:hypothetical protein
MAGVSAERFEQKIRERCAKSSSVMRVVSISESKRHVRMRIFLINRSFVDVYYNHETGKTAFAHIQKTKRIFGADNTNGYWHWHPYQNPEEHIAVEKDISFDAFLQRLETNLSEE